jgi:hypothetical protein
VIPSSERTGPRAGVAVGDRHPRDGVGGVGLVEVGDDLAGPVGSRHRGELSGARVEGLERAAAAAEPGGWGPPVDGAVGVGGVLGEVDGEGVGVDAAGLVDEPAEGFDRLRVSVGLQVDRVDLEDVAVTVLVGLLAGQPGAPGGDPASAVGGGPGECDGLPDELAVGGGLDDGAAAAGVLAPGVAAQVRDGAAVVGAAADLVVEHDEHVPVRGWERGGTVVDPGGGVLGVEAGLPGLGDHSVGEPLGQREHAVRVVDEGPVSGCSTRLCRGCGAVQQTVDRAGHGDTETDLP